MRRFLALGDSYTIGEGVRPDERWPVQLTGMLRRRGVAMHDPEIVAQTGWTTEELAAALREVQPAGSYDLVSLLIGVNDQYRGRGMTAFLAGFDALLHDAVRLAGHDPARVLVLSIPDWGVTPFAAGRDRASIAAEIDALNDASRDRAVAAGASWVDVTESTRAMGQRPELVVADHLHPSGALYARWAALVLPLAESILNAG